MPSPSFPNNQKCLLVEGQDDRHLIEHICKKYLNEKNLPFVIKDKDGIDNIIKSITGEIKAPNREALGIMTDTNGDLANTWNKITTQLKEETVVDYLKIDQKEIPDKPKSEGVLIKCKPYIGIWLMPDNESSGEIENFFLKMLPKEDHIWPLAKAYIAQIPRHHRLFSPEKEEKAKLYAWLATRKNPGRMGASVTRDELNLDDNLIKGFLKWLCDLFHI